MTPAIFGISGLDLTAEEHAFFKEADPAGYILFARNCDNRDQLRRLTDDLRAIHGRDRLIISIDQEGGRVVRMKAPEWQRYPAGEAFARLWDIAPASAIEAARDVDAEAIVVLGGGSAIDVAKGVAIVMTNGGSIADYEGDSRFNIAPLPLVAVPTTAGTGSEVSGAAVISDTKRGVKMAIRHPVYGPATHAILDPLAVSTTPRSVAVNSGIDAFVHALESYVSKAATPFSDALNRHAMRLISTHIRAYVDDPGNEAAALGMLCGSSMAAASFGVTGTGNVHCMAMSLGSFHALPHGLCIALLLPHVAAFNASAAPRRFADVARDMGEATDGLGDAEAADRALVAIRQMTADLGVSGGLAAAGVPAGILPAAADRCFALDYNRWNPRFTTRDQYLQLFESAM